MMTGGPASGHPQYALLRGFKRDHWVEFCERYGAHGIGIGWKSTGGLKTNILALLFYVGKKLPLKELGERAIPSHFLLDRKDLEEPVQIITDVVETPASMLE